MVAYEGYENNQANTPSCQIDYDDDNIKTLLRRELEDCRIRSNLCQ